MDLTGWWLPCLSLCMGVGAAVLTHLGIRVYGTGRGRRKHKEWLVEAEHRMMAAVQADLAAAEARAALAEMIGQLPSDFDATLLLAVNIGSAFQRASIYEAERQELVPTGTFARLYGASFEGEADRVRMQADSPSMPPPKDSASHWVGSHRINE